MNRFAVKVCGMTRPRDARLAAELGADMIGLIFYRRSPRFVSIATARKIIEVIPATVTPVGVFVDTPAEHLLEITRRLRLGFGQLHGAYSVADERMLRRAGLRTIRVLHGAPDMSKAHPERSDLLLIDNRSDNAVGGTGKPFDWSVKIPKRINNLVLAGGIDADNVTEGIERFKPVMIDVNSGVESRPGIKSERKLRHFFEVCNKLRYGR